MPEWFNGAVLKTVEGFVLRGFKSYRLRHHWGVVKWLRHRSLTPTFRGSNPLTPAKIEIILYAPKPPLNGEVTWCQINYDVIFFKLRISFNGKTSAFQADDTGSIPAIRSNLLFELIE